MSDFKDKDETESAGTSCAFNETGITNQAVIEKLTACNILKPTKVQENVIPLILSGKNVMFQSETGTGKTFAYLLPLVQKLLAEENPRREVKLLIASPTYELASQIKVQVQKICALNCVLCIGGAPISRQIEMLKTRPQIVIGSAGRLLELIHLKKLKADAVEALVLDEADRLLSKELRDDTEGLMERLPKQVQLIGNSATVSEYTRQALEKARERIISENPDNTQNAQDIQNNNGIILVSLPPEDILRKRITHWAIFAERRDKIDTLRSFINAEKPPKLLVFTSRKDQIENIVSKLKFKKIDCEGLSGGTDKKLRKAYIDRFRSGKLKVLVTTDLASRGLEGLNVADLAGRSILSRPAISHHLKVLKDAGIVEPIKKGTQIFYRLKLKDSLVPMKKLFDTVEEILEEEEIQS